MPSVNYGTGSFTLANLSDPATVDANLVFDSTGGVDTNGEETNNCMSGSLSVIHIDAGIDSGGAVDDDTSSCTSGSLSVLYALMQHEAHSSEASLLGQSGTESDFPLPPPPPPPPKSLHGTEPDGAGISVLEFAVENFPNNSSGVDVPEFVDDAVGAGIDRGHLAPLYGDYDLII
jgi:hypothetical protein